MHFDKQFFKKTGYKVTDDPIQPEPRPKALLAYFERFNEEARNPRPGTVAAIRKAISEFPDHPTLYNNLYMALEQSNRPAEARTVLREILERFPDYPFGKIMLAHQRLEDKDLPGARRALGTTGDIREFLPDTESFHYSLFNAYHAVAGRIEALLGNIKEAKDHLRLLLQLDPESVHAKTLGLIVFQEGPIKNMAERKKASDALPHIEVKVPEKYTQTTDEPTLHHPEVGELIILPYDSMPERVQHQLLALPRETLVADLCTLLADSISRFDYYESTEEDEAGNPPHHALALLAFLKAGEALPVVLDTLRQADSYSDFWFGDTPDLSYNWYLISIAEQRLPALQEFARERNISWLNKNHVNRAVAQMGLHWPETRPKAIAWYADLFRYLLDNEADKDLIDAQFISFAISESTDLRAAELLPLIREIDAKGWIDEQVMGKLTEIEEKINREPDPWDKAPLPLDLNDFYQEEYLKRREESNRPPLEMPFDEDDPVEQHMLRLIGKMLFAKKGYDDEYEDDDDEDDDEDHWLPPVKPVETIRRAEPKVGRNDPCPCGSGKKYKRCHGKDA